MATSGVLAGASHSGTGGAPATTLAAGDSRDPSYAQSASPSQGITQSRGRRSRSPHRGTPTTRPSPAEVAC